MKDVKLLLQDTGLKATNSRMEVLGLLIEAHKPISIENMQKILGKKSPDRVTLYRMMNQFYTVGLVRRIDFREGFERFEFQDHHHHHIVCTSCGTTESFEVCEAGNLTKKILKQSKKFDFIKDHSLELFGLCTKCTGV